MNAVLEQATEPPDIPCITGQVGVRQAKAYYLRARQRLELEMDQLVARSKLDVSPVYLQRHRHKSGGYNTDASSLRWRFREAGANKHLLWEDVQQLLPQLPAAVVRHYERLNRRVMEVNTLSLVAYQTVRAFDTLASKSVGGPAA